MYTHYNGTHNNVCTKLRTTVYGGGRGLRGPVGVGWCACDKTNTVNHVHAHLVGLGGVCWGSVHYAQCFGSYRTWGVGSTATTRTCVPSVVCATMAHIIMCTKLRTTVYGGGRGLRGPGRRGSGPFSKARTRRCHSPHGRPLLEELGGSVSQPAFEVLGLDTHSSPTPSSSA